MLKDLAICFGITMKHLHALNYVQIVHKYVQV